MKSKDASTSFKEGERTNRSKKPSKNFNFERDNDREGRFVNIGTDDESTSPRDNKTQLEKLRMQSTLTANVLQAYHSAYQQSFCKTTRDWDSDNNSLQAPNRQVHSNIHPSASDNSLPRHHFHSQQETMQNNSQLPTFYSESNEDETAEAKPARRKKGAFASLITITKPHSMDYPRDADLNHMGLPTGKFQQFNDEDSSMPGVPNCKRLSDHIEVHKSRKSEHIIKDTNYDFDIAPNLEIPLSGAKAFSLRNKALSQKYRKNFFQHHHPAEVKTARERSPEDQMRVDNAGEVKLEKKDSISKIPKSLNIIAEDTTVSKIFQGTEVDSKQKKKTRTRSFIESLPLQKDQELSQNCISTTEKQEAKLYELSPSIEESNNKTLKAGNKTLNATKSFPKKNLVESFARDSPMNDERDDHQFQPKVEPERTMKSEGYAQNSHTSFNAGLNDTRSRDGSKERRRSSTHRGGGEDSLVVTLQNENKILEARLVFLENQNIALEKDIKHLRNLHDKDKQIRATLERQIELLQAEVNSGKEKGENGKQKGEAAEVKELKKTLERVRGEREKLRGELETQKTKYKEHIEKLESELNFYRVSTTSRTLMATDYNPVTARTNTETLNPKKLQTKRDSSIPRFDSRDDKENRRTSEGFCSNNELQEYKRTTKKFIECVTKMVVDCSGPSELDSEKPNLKQVWKFLKRIMSEFVELKRDGASAKQDRKILKQCGKLLVLDHYSDIPQKLEHLISLKDRLMVITTKLKDMLHLPNIQTLDQFEEFLCNNNSY